ncbi:PLP-dependent aminotransferase family protein [Paractinoplanes rishiriensis]|uniref:aminotransferase-like domain-containing protein n=1 Tax=Paractinoplanes rishiriensis TaxID=1050105 RepID=UPI001940D095|nr:PLP-dependent aminotransferase family protein [Actinoplanes rishiriensis]
MIQFERRPGILDLGWGHPRPGLLPVEEWAAAGAEAARTFGWQQLTYGHATGPAPLVDWLCAHLADGTRFAQTFVTGGASHALALVASLLAGPGDVILVDSPTYHLAFRILADTGATLRRMPGSPAELAGLVRTIGRRVPFLYLVPTFGNPTGRSLDDARRRELIEVARREGLLLVEDDTYRELVYEGTAPPSLWELSGGSGVVRLGSFAKTVAPGLRLGWVNAAPDLIGRLAGLGYVDSGGGVNHATAVTMASFGTSGVYDRHVARLRDAYRLQRDALVAAVRAHLPVEVPQGGWFLWVRLPGSFSGTRLLPPAEKAGVSFVPGTRFCVDDGDGDDHVRLSFSHLPPADLTEAATRLGQLIATLPGHE